jgi:hypothetical protein
VLAVVAFWLPADGALRLAVKRVEVKLDRRSVELAHGNARLIAGVSHLLVHCVRDSDSVWGVKRFSPWQLSLLDAFLFLYN